jgi:NADPH:quinone reductase-like Zn-dependent oxidoreductase
MPEDRMLMIAGSTSDMIFGGLKARLDGKRFIGGVASESIEVLRKVIQMAADDHFHPVIDRCYDFSQMVAAHAHVDTGHKKGNVVVTVTTDIQSQRRMVPTLPNVIASR